jgi:hypothetical protein
MRAGVVEIAGEVVVLNDDLASDFHHPRSHSILA